MNKFSVGWINFGWLVGWLVLVWLVCCCLNKKTLFPALLTLGIYVVGTFHLNFAFPHNHCCPIQNGQVKQENNQNHRVSSVVKRKYSNWSTKTLMSIFVYQKITCSPLFHKGLPRGQRILSKLQLLLSILLTFTSHVSVQKF